MASSPVTICARKPDSEIAARIKEQIVALIVRSIIPVAIRSPVLFRIRPRKMQGRESGRGRASAVVWVLLSGSKSTFRHPPVSGIHEAR